MYVKILTWCEACTLEWCQEAKELSYLYHIKQGLKELLISVSREATFLVLSSALEIISFFSFLSFSTCDCNSSIILRLFLSLTSNSFRS